MRKVTNDVKVLEAICDVSHNPNRIDATTRLNFVTAYHVGENLSKPDVATARGVARLDFESRHMRDSMPERVYDAAQKRAVGFDSISDTVSRSTKNKQHLSQNTIVDWFPDVRAIATWTGANRSTFLHETGHMFLDMRVRIAQDLALREANGEELSAGQKHLLGAALIFFVFLSRGLRSFSRSLAKDNRSAKRMFFPKPCRFFRSHSSHFYFPVPSSFALLAEVFGSDSEDFSLGWLLGFQGVL